MKISLVVVLCLGALLVATGSISVRFFLIKSGAGATTASPVVQDMLAIQDATASTNAAPARHEVIELINRAAKLKRADRARMLRATLPSAARLAADEFARGRDAVAATPIRTPEGSNCREGVLRLAARSETVYRNLAIELEEGYAPWPAVRQFAVGANAALDSYALDVHRCVESVSSEDRGEVLRLLTS